MHRGDEGEVNRQLSEYGIEQMSLYKKLIKTSFSRGERNANPIICRNGYKC